MEPLYGDTCWCVVDVRQKASNSTFTSIDRQPLVCLEDAFLVSERKVKLPPEGPANSPREGSQVWISFESISAVRPYCLPLQIESQPNNIRSATTLFCAACLVCSRLKMTKRPTRDTPRSKQWTMVTSFGRVRPIMVRCDAGRLCPQTVPRKPRNQPRTKRNGSRRDGVRSDLHLNTSVRSVDETPRRRESPR